MIRHPSPAPPSTLVGGVGYHDLCDFSAGARLVEALATETWPAGVVIEDLGYGPVKVVHRLQDEARPFRRLVVAGAVRRGRAAGHVEAYRWDGALPPVEEIQDRVAEAVTGVVGLDNLLIVVGALGPLPDDVAVIEIEPLREEVGSTLTAPVEAAVNAAARIARALALAPRWDLPVAALGGTPGRPDAAARGGA